MRPFTFTLIIALSITHAALAERMDVNTHDQIIEKLESSVEQLESQESRTFVKIRLADLLADRARLKAIAEGEQNCVNCLDAEADRKRAIRYYEEALGPATKEDQPRILLQMTHLHFLNGDVEAAERIFQKIIAAKPAHTRDLVGEAYAGLGEIAFRSGDFAKAQKHFETALRHPIAKVDQVTHRLAWCRFNRGDSRSAVTSLVALLESGKVQNSAHRKDMARDLATFVARDGITSASIDKILKLSDPEDQKANLFYLGQEADRLGNKKGSLLVWDRYSQFKDVRPEEAMEIQIRSAQTHFDRGDIALSLAQYQTFHEMASKRKCSDASVCDELRARARVYVHNWIKKEKSRPTSDLLKALEIYVKYNGEDTEMVYWAGNISRVLNDMARATGHYHRAADLADGELKQDLGEEKRRAWTRIAEGSFLSEIECAEAARNAELRERAYLHYLKARPKGAKRDEVKYQLAHLKYEKKQYSEAASAFDQLVEGNGAIGGSLKVKAADLALDSLGILKDNDRLEATARRYAGAIPSKKKEYLGIARRAAVNAAIAQFAGGKAGASAQRAALTRLQNAPIFGATTQEKIGLYRNQILIAESLKDVDAVQAAAERILAISKISAEDREFALGRVLWAQELKLDFPQAFRTAKKMSFPGLKPHERKLKLAVLADLAGKNGRTYYDQYIKATPSVREANMIRAKLVRESKRPWRELKSVAPRLRRTPDLFAATVLIAFAKDQNYRELEKYVKEGSVRRSPGHAVLNRFLTLNAERAFDREIAKHRLDAKTDKRLQKSFDKRLRLLREAEAKAQRASASGDFTLQIVSFGRVAREYDRLYSDFVKLPAPRGLNKKQRAEYTNLVEVKAAPFKKTATEVRAKIAELWRKDGTLDTLIKAASESSDVRSLAVAELKILKNHAPPSQNRRIAAALKPSIPGQREIEKARASLRKNPFDRDSIVKLKGLEEKRGSYSMATYLDGRLQQIHKEASR